MIFPRENFRSVPALAAFVVTVIVGLGLDLWTKSLAFERLAKYDRGAHVVDSDVYRFIPGWLEFTVTTNHGAVFGVGLGYPPFHEARPIFNISTSMGVLYVISF